MQKKKRGRARKNSKPKKVRLRNYFRKGDLLLAAGGAAYFGYTAHKSEHESIKQTKAKFARKKMANAPTYRLDLCGCQTFSKNASLNPEFQTEAYESFLKGESEYGEVQWLLLHTIYKDHGLPFKPPYFDTNNIYLLGPKMDELAESIPLLKEDLEIWRSVRAISLLRPWENNTASDGVLLAHVQNERDISSALIQLENQKEKVKYTTAAYATITFVGAMMFLVAATWIWQGIVKRYMNRKLAKIQQRALAQTRENMKVPPKKKEKEPEEEFTPIPPSRKRLNTSKTFETKKILQEEKKKRQKKAMKKIREIFEEDAEKVLLVLSKKLSNRIMDDLIEGETQSLDDLICRNKKQFEMLDIDVETLLEQIRSIRVESSDPSEDIPRRSHHKLDKVPREGWNMLDFHDLLKRYGFDTSRSARNGENYVIYGNDKLPDINGGIVTIHPPDSKKQVNPILADIILTICADYLVQLEQTPIKNVI
jgi:hypothetical protein